MQMTKSWLKDASLIRLVAYDVIELANVAEQADNGVGHVVEGNRPISSS